MPPVGAGRAPLLIKPGWLRAGLVLSFPFPFPFPPSLSCNHRCHCCNSVDSLDAPSHAATEAVAISHRTLTVHGTFLGYLETSLCPSTGASHFVVQALPELRQRVTFQPTTPLRPAQVPFVVAVWHNTNTTVCPRRIALCPDDHFIPPAQLIDRDAYNGPLYLRAPDQPVAFSALRPPPLYAICLCLAAATGEATRRFPLLPSAGPMNPRHPSIASYGK